MAQYFEYAFVKLNASSGDSLSYSMYLRKGNENTLDDKHYLKYKRQLCEKSLIFLWEQTMIALQLTNIHPGIFPRE